MSFYLRRMREMAEECGIEAAISAWDGDAERAACWAQAAAKCAREALRRDGTWAGRANRRTWNAVWEWLEANGCAERWERFKGALI